MKGITVESNLAKGDEAYTIIKSKGKLTLDDIQQALAEHERLLPPLLYCPNCSCKLKAHEDYKEGSE